MENDSSSTFELSLPQEIALTTSMSRTLCMCGVGWGKSHIIGIESYYYIKNFPHVDGFIGANTHGQLTDSTLKKCRDVWRDEFDCIAGRDYVVGVKPPEHFNTERHNYDKYHNIISWKNGAVIFKGSMDNAKAHDGKEFAWSLMDEVKDTKEKDIKDTILTRLRQPGLYWDTDGILVGLVDDENETAKEKAERLGYKDHTIFKMYTSSAAVDWINEWFKLEEFEDDIYARIFDKDDFFAKEYDNKCVVISSTYWNEHNLTDGYIDGIIADNPQNYKALIFGDPFVKGGNEFYGSFDRQIHVIDYEYDSTLELPVHVSFDQNVNPYITACLYVVEYEGNCRKVIKFDELCLKNPKNNSESLAIEIEAKHFRKLKNGFFYYGDPAGKKSDTRKNEHDYILIERVLGDYISKYSNRVPYKHPPVIKRRDFMNKILSGGYSDIKYFVDRRCKNSIKDKTFLKQDKNGKKLKELDEDGYEKLGHTSDADDYFLTQLFDDEFERDYL